MICYNYNIFISSWGVFSMKSYYVRLVRAARWRLPPQEAAEVLEDYRDILSAVPRSEEELLRDFGSPAEAVRPLCAPKAYRLWLAVFALLAACLLFPLFYMAFPYARVPLSWFTAFHWPAVLLSGLILALVWFRRTPASPVKGLPAAMCLLLAACVGEALLFVWFSSFLDAPQAPHLVGRTALWSLLALALLAALSGLRGLVNARLQNRRWLGLYTLSLTAACLALHFSLILTCMSVDPAYHGNPLLYHWPAQLALPSLLGLAGTVLALC